MASPRCQSRDSSSGRCPSDESVYSNRGGMGGQGMSPVGLQLPPSLPPGALLPQHSAAMAAYLNVAAAAAAQQNRLMLSSPMRHSMHRERSSSPMDHDDGPILDFSKKRKSSCDQSDSNDENNSDNEIMKTDSSPLDLSVSTRKRMTSDESPHHSPRKMSRPAHDFNKHSPWNAPAQLPFFANAVAAAAASGLSPKTLAAEWNGKNKMHSSSLPSDATKALEKMSELSRIGDEMFRSSQSNNSSHERNLSHDNRNSSSVSAPSAGRHSAWQSHWLNKGADTAKDVLKCVWCKQSFPSLAAMTTHMKETKHCGVSMPPQSNSHQSSSQSQQSSSHSHQVGSNAHNNSSNSSMSHSKSDLNLLIKETMPLPRKLVRGQDVWLGKGAEQTRQILKCMWCGQSFRSLAEMTSHMQQTQHYTNIISQEQIISWRSGGGGSASGGAAASASAPGNNSNNSGNNSGNESNSTETKASTRGESGNNNNNNNSTSSSSNNNNNNSNSSASNVVNTNVPPSSGGNALAASNNSHVSAVLTCKVCDQAFSSLKELSNHMVKNAHYKEHIMRSITESGSRRKQTREKRKKSLPVRKLLELERAQNDFKNGDSIMLNKPLRDMSAGRITCEKCGDKIDTASFVDHIRQCIGSSTALSPAQKLKSALMSNTIIPPDSISPVNSRDGRKSISDSDMTSPNSIRQRSSPVSINSMDLSSSSKMKNSDESGSKSTSSPSVLNAIEQLIEKSFDTRSRHGSTNFPSVNQNSTTTLGSSILKRLGIDESVDYTKPLVDAQTMTLLRNYHNAQQQNYLAAQFARTSRERSGSESSSERGSSRGIDSATPDKKYDLSMRGSPEKQNIHHHHHQLQQQQQHHHESDDDKPLKIKREIEDDEKLASSNNLKRNSTPLRSIKKEANDMDEDDNNTTITRNSSSRESANIQPNNNNNETEDEDDKPLKLIKTAALMNNRSPRESPSSPMSDHHSIASRSTPSETLTTTTTTTSSKKKMMSGGSLGALSSMFDNLTNDKGPNQGENGGGGKRSKAHPLAALQKLCDKNEHSPNTRSGSASLALAPSPSLIAQQQANANRASAMLAFNWACQNDGGNGEDGNMKCAFCDTTFTSKGAYRHHLSKVHFINDDLISDAIPLKANSKLPPPQAHSPKSPVSISPKSNASVDNMNSSRGNGLAQRASKKSPSPVGIQSSSHERHNKSDLSVAATSSSSSSSTTTYDESPHSKFLKYTELAKQLSSKYV